MFGSFPGSLGRDHYQAYRLEGADAIMESKPNQDSAKVEAVLTFDF